MKKALVLYYSQAGQTETALQYFCRGLEINIQCDFKRIIPNEDFKFPWKISPFFRAFPRAVQGLAPTIQPLDIVWDDYDLVILGCQVWFLSPSLPVQGFLNSVEAHGLKNKKIVTLMTCRNLWHSASRSLRQRLLTLGANHLGQITVAETSPVWASFVTTPRWMLTGKKAGFLFFPPAGISDQDFLKLEALGREMLTPAPDLSSFAVNQFVFGSNLNKVSLVLMDRIGFQLFRMWSALILSVAKRPGIWQDFWLILFRLNLVLLIITIGPCTKVFELLVRNSPRFLK